MTMKGFERLSGPWHDLYIAAYAAPFEGFFCGYSKLFEDAPDHPWIPGALVKIAAGMYTTPSDAIDAAESLGKSAAMGLWDGRLVVVRTQLFMTAFTR
jgi:hypothetical protein